MTTLNRLSLPPSTETRVALLLASSFVALTGAAISPALPAIQEHFRGLPNAALLVQLMLSSVGLSIALSAPLIGQLTDRFGRRPILLVSILLFVLTGASGLLIDTLPLLILSRVLLGVAVAGLMIGVSALAADLFDGTARTRFVTQQSAFTSLGGVLFVPLAGVLAGLNWHAPFALFLVPLLLLPSLWRLPRAPPPPRPSILPAGLSADGARLRLAVGLGCMSAFAYMLVFFQIPSQLPFTFTAYGLSSTALGGVFGLGTLITGATGLLYARFGSHLPPARSAAAGLLVMAIGWFLMAQGGPFTLLMTGYVFGTLGAGIVLPTINAWVIHAAPGHARGRVVSLLTASTFLGQFLSPLAAQPLLNLGGIGLLFTVAAGLLATLMVILLSVSARIGRAQAPHSASG